MKRSLGIVVLLLFVSGLFCSCSMMTAQGRRERAYDRYVEKMSRGRAQQQQHLSAIRAQVPPAIVSQPVVTADASGPESVTADNGSGGL